MTYVANALDPNVLRVKTEVFEEDMGNWALERPTSSFTMAEPSRLAGGEKK